MQMIWWSLPLTLIVYFAARYLAKKIHSPLFNPLVIAMAAIISLLVFTGIPYDDYFSGSKVINDLLQPAVVALAFPLYEQLHQIRNKWKSILTICFFASLSGMLSGAFIALWLGATPEIAASVLPKSVSTPIAMAIAESIDGIPAISAVCVMIAGIFGAVFGHSLLNLFRIKNPAARGLAIGASAHALGTARCAEIDYHEGVYSSLALVVCGIITSLLAPFLFPLILTLYNLF